MNQPNPHMLRLAMDIRAKTITDLSEDTGITERIIRAYLSGQLTPIHAGAVEKFSKALSFPASFFYHTKQPEVGQWLDCPGRGHWFSPVAPEEEQLDRFIAERRATK